jgi:hypothetical protein
LSQYSSDTKSLIGTTGTAIGTGYANTIAMVNQDANTIVMVNQVSTAASAGTIARAYRGPNNLSDWFLPSADELSLIALHRTYFFEMDDRYFWSSSEAGAGYAWAQYLSRGVSFSSLDKREGLFVRPIRAF